MVVALNAGFTSPLHKRRLVLTCSETNDNSISTTSVDSSPSSDSNKPVTESVESSNGSTKRAPSTARERLRADRVLSRYTEATPKPSKSKMGSQILDVLKESDKKSNRKSGLPEAPTTRRKVPRKRADDDGDDDDDSQICANYHDQDNT